MTDTTTALSGNNVVQTSTIPLATYIQQKQQQLAMVTQQISRLQLQGQSILTELQALVPASPAPEGA